MRILSIILSIVIGLSFFNCNQSSAQQSTLLKPQEFKDFLANNDVLLLDVRTPGEYSSGHIENAININFLSPEFDEEIKKLDTSKTLVIYCRSGNRSGKSTSKLVKAGFTDIYDLKGGVLNWQKSGLELVK